MGQVLWHRCMEREKGANCGPLRSAEARRHCHIYQEMSVHYVFSRMLEALELSSLPSETWLLRSCDSRGHRNIAAINDFRPGIEGIRVQWDVVSATKSNPS